MNLKSIIAILLFLTAVMHAQTMSRRIEKDIDHYASHLETKPELAFYYIDKAYRNSIRIGNDSLIARSLCNLGYYHYSKGNHAQAKAHYLKAIAYARSVRYGKILSYSYNQLGIIEAQDDQFDEALSWYLASLKVANAHRLPEIKSRTLLNLGNLYMIQADTLKGIEYYQQNIANAQQHKLNKELAQGYITMALIYSASDTEKTLKYYHDALRIAREGNDDATAFIIHLNLSDFYLNSPMRGSMAKSLGHLRQASEIQRRSNDESQLFFVHFNLGGYYLTKKQYELALDYYKQALALPPKSSTSNQKLNLYKSIAAAYGLKNDYKRAYLYQEKYRNLNDSIFNINKNIAFNEIQTKYEVEKKNLKIDLLSKEKTIERTKRQIVIFVGISLIVPLLLLTLFYRKKNKMQKVISEKEHELFVQERIKLENEQEIERVVGMLEGQATERDRIAGEIHDGIGGDLAGIKLYLSKINASLHNEQIEGVIQRLTGLFQELRNISHNLSSNFLKDKDFYVVLAELEQEYRARNEFALEIVVYPHDAFKEVSETFKHQLYRIIQELLANASKHANAQKVGLNITRHDDFFNIIVEDDGVGFDQMQHSGIGLKNIRDRLKSLQGTLSIESQPNNGSFITIDIPCN